ncbi:hypothetical protein ACIRPK_22285 [Kitasatospora sp. NPDC101801]|uniref:hypothetical protein n=1 Tax=Kitasatospora sp. NPDC101801 TaxID=3364103 RepID=UPI0038227E37
MSSDSKFEEDLTYALSRTAEAFRTETTRLDMVGLERGRRAWRHRRTTMTAAGATTLALVGGSVYLMAGIAPTGSAATAASDRSASPSPAGLGRASGPAPVSSARMLTALQAALPAGSFSNPEGLEDADVPIPGAMLSARFDDGHGLGVVSVRVERWAQQLTAGAQEVRCPDPGLRAYDSCETSTLADGSVLTLFQGPEYPDGRLDTKRWAATLSGRDGRLVELSEWNSSASKGSPSTRPTPPLTPAQLTSAVTSHVWDAVLADLPVTEAQQTRPAAFPTAEIVATAARLLPRGLTPATVGASEDGYAGFTVDDGKGASLVEINVQDWSRSITTISGRYSTGETLPDGTRLLTSQEGSDPGHWTVEALRPNGLRVVVSVYNSAGLHQPASRTTRALTTEQLKAIATSPEWKLSG